MEKTVLINRIKEINALSMPLVLNAIFSLIIKITDQMMLGRVSVEAFAAVGVISTLLYTIAGIIGITTVTLNINGSKLKGLGDEKGLKIQFTSSLLFNSVIGVGVALIILIFKHPLIIYIYNFNGEVLNHSIDYLSIMSIYVLLQLLLFNFSTLFKINKKNKMDIDWLF
ncbi:MATE family efflux transporter [Bacillus carboniphilus]|uniref:Probable multidrug resistance protein NorM n=1 Tax=Bacillus carboniphilus TaxID=86663 RepID=A0ABY9JS77_9BACI|nr:MATE family efflux transporter [Bacillus carboniphilus]WLR42261.1 MATE family efflux transporter [Bacillus carboniphilus]